MIVFDSLERSLHYVFVVGALACVSVAKHGDSEVTATLTRGGGLTGVAETIRIWSAEGRTESSFERSDKRGSRPVHLSRAKLDSTLSLLDSLAGAVPLIPPDTAVLRTISAVF